MTQPVEMDVPERRGVTDEVGWVGDEQAETPPVDWEGSGAHPAPDALDGDAGDVLGNGPVVGDVVPDRFSRGGVLGEAAQREFGLTG